MNNQGQHWEVLVLAAIALLLIWVAYRKNRPE